MLRLGDQTPRFPAPLVVLRSAFPLVSPPASRWAISPISLGFPIDPLPFPHLQACNHSVAGGFDAFKGVTLTDQVFFSEKTSYQS